LPLTARNGHTLKILGIARISTDHQDALSLDDQLALYRRWLAEHTVRSLTPSPRHSSSRDRGSPRKARR
jgi:hypothetical protein